MAGTENGQDGSRQGDADFGNQQVAGGSFRRTVEMQKLAKNNRENLFALGKRPSMMSEEEEMIIREYGNSIQLAIAYEKEKLYNLEQTFMAILAEPKRFAVTAVGQP